MVKLYSNENFPLPVVKELRGLGYDVLTIQETGKAEQSLSDEDVLVFSIKEERILITLNRKHFIRLHHHQPNHQGIIVCSFDPDFIGQAHRIHKAIESQAQFSGQLIRIDRPQKQ
jgi:uncharacterized protein with PIN domain